MKYIISLLKTGWGVFLIASGIISVILDLFGDSFHLKTEDHGNIPLLPEGSATLGWIGVILTVVFPAAIFRNIRKGHIHSGLAVIWCILAIFVWFGIKALLSDGPPRSGLTLVAATFFCWRLLTRKEEEFKK